MSNHNILSLLLIALRSIILIVKFSLTLFIARFLGLEDLGIFGLINAVAIMGPIFLGLGLIHTINRKAVTDCLQVTTNSLKYYGKFLVLSYVFIFFVSVGICYISNIQYIVVVMIVVVFFEHIGNDQYNLMLNLSKPFVANFLHFIRGGLWSIFFMSFSYFNPEYRTLESLITAWLFGSLVSILGFFWIARRWPWKIFEDNKISLFEWVVGEFKISRTLYKNGIAESLTHYMDRFLVTLFLGLELTGVYVFFMQIISALSNLMLTGIIQIARPKMVKAYKFREDNYLEILNQCIKKTWFFSTIMALLAAISVYYIIPFVNRPVAASSYPIFCFLLLVFVISMHAYAKGLLFYSQHLDNLTFKINIVNAAGMVLMFLLLLPMLGLWGAALTNLFFAISKISLQNFFIKNNKIIDLR